MKINFSKHTFLAHFHFSLKIRYCIFFLTKVVEGKVQSIQRVKIDQTFSSEGDVFTTLLNADIHTLPSNIPSGIFSLWNKTTLIRRCVGRAGADPPSSNFLKRGNFHYDLGSKCANFQQKISSDTS